MRQRLMWTIWKIFYKSKINKSPDQSAPLFAQIWREASSAQDNLAELPYDHNTISKALKFLSQASDFSFSMTNKAIEGFELDEEDWKKVDQLKKYAKILSDELNKIKQEVNDGKRIDWEEIESEGEKG